jgi:hypothetical protein
MTDQAKNEQAAERLTASEPVRVTKPAERTAVKTRRIAPGQYTSLDGQVLASRNEDGKGWTLAKRDGEEWTALKRDYRTSDEALTAAVTDHGFQLEALNTPPKKAAKPAPTKPEAKEEGTNERRTGATGKAPRRPSTNGDKVHVRKARASKVA